MRGAVSLCLPILLPRGRDQVPAPVSGSRSVPLRNSKSSLAAAAQQLGFPPTLFSSSISRSPSSDRTTRVYFYNANQGYLAFKCAVVYESAWRKVGTQDSCQLHATLQPRCNNISARSDNCQIEPATAEDVMFSTMASFKDRNAVGLSVNAATACSRVVGVLQIGADVDERCIVDGTPRLLLCTTPPADKRVQESSRIRQKYPERVPVIVEKAAKSDIPDIDKNKFLVPSDLTVGQFVYVIRKRLSLPSTKAVFLFVNNVSPPSSQLMKEVFAQHQDSDGFLYVKYSGEETFG